jgi:hypothetical protein
MSKKSRKPKNTYKFVEHFKTNDKEQLNELLGNIINLYFTQTLPQKRVM